MDAIRCTALLEAGTNPTCKRGKAPRLRVGLVWLAYAGTIAAVGCLEPEQNTMLVPDTPFGTQAAAAPQRRAAYAPAGLEAAARVDTIGRQILAANPQVALRPVFSAIGGPEPEIFHVGVDQLVITEGLVKTCTTDGQLAAVLCLEMGKMVSEREAKSGAQKRANDRLPPMDMRMGIDNGSFGGPPDQTNLAELAKFDRRPPVQAAKPLPPDPHVLANIYLTKAGYPAAELDNVAPILREAAKHSAFEKQFLAPGPARPWTH